MNLMITANDNFMLKFKFCKNITKLINLLLFRIDCKITCTDKDMSFLLKYFSFMSLCVCIRDAQNFKLCILLLHFTNKI